MAYSSNFELSGLGSSDSRGLYSHDTGIQAVNTHFKSLVTYFTKRSVNRVLKQFLLLLLFRNKGKTTQGNIHPESTLTNKKEKENTFTQNRSLLIYILLIHIIF